MSIISETLKMEIEEGYDFNWDETNHIMQFLANQHDHENRGKVWLWAAHDRMISRIVEKGHVKYSDAPDSPRTEGKIAREYAKDNPILFLLKQQGNKEQGWKGYPFYWPVLYAQENIRTVIYAPENNL